VRVGTCAASELRTAQWLLREHPSAVRGLRPGGRARLLTGVLAVSRSGELRLCSGFSGRSDCGSAGYRVAGASVTALGAGRYPWVVARELYARLGRDGRLHDLVVAGSPLPHLSGPSTSGQLHALVTAVSGRTFRADPVDFLTGDAANLAAARDRAEVPISNDAYVSNPVRRAETFVLRPDATFMVVNLEHEAFADQVTYAAWKRVVRVQPDRVWQLRLDPIGRVRSVREQFMP
jgi:hypothetical protein